MRGSKLSPIADDDSLPIEVRVLVELASIKTMLQNGLTKVDDHEGRIRSIEQHQSSPLRAYLPTISTFAGFGSLAVAVTALLMK